MCSIEEADLADMRSREEAERLKTSTLSTSGPTLCQKCRSEPAVLLLRVNDIYCRACFIAAFTHKFRSTLGKSRLVRPDEPALLAFSGGPASSALARLVSDGARQTDSKRLRLRPRMVLVDESAVVGRQDVRQVERLAGSYGLAVYRVQLEAVMDDTGAVVAELVKPGLDETPTDGSAGGQVSAGGKPATPAVSCRVNTSGLDEARMAALRAQLCRLWSAAGSGTAQEQLLERLRGELLARAAVQLGCRLLLLGDTETRLAISLLTGLACGRGAHAHQQTALADRRHGEGLLTLRPLREVSSKQVALFVHHRQVEYVPGWGPDTMAPATASIGRATEDFVLGLQTSFPATVSTVYRTGTKLSAVGTLAADCALCRLPLDTGGGAASALQATRFSQLVSSSGPASFDYSKVAAAPTAGAAKVTGPPSVGESGGCGSDKSRCVDASGCCGGGECDSKTAVSRKPSREELLDSLCYGCQLIVRDMKDVGDMPQFVSEEAAVRTRREKMRREIQGFLIDDS